MSVLITAAAAIAQVATPIKWACIGNSITDGDNSYPSRLAGRLGPAFKIENDGVSGCTLLKRGDKPYWTQGKLANVFAFRPDIITIKLGTNDTKPQNWQYQADFVKDLTAMVDTLSGMSSKPQILLCLPVPIFPNTIDIRDPELNTGVIPRIKQVAAAKGLTVIDLNTPLKGMSGLYKDGVHPNDAGSDSITAIIYRAFLAQATRVACIGNSITQYVGNVAGAVVLDAYPTKLNMLLGRKYVVLNAGVSGCYMLKPNSGIPTIMSYWNKGKFGEVFAFKPNMITISLGTNDSRPKAWNTAKYVADYKAMIDTLSGRIVPKPKIWLVKPIPAWQVNGIWPFSTPSGTTDNGITGNTIRDSVIPAAQIVATQKDLPTIDLYPSFLALKSQVADGVHPNAVGQDTIAHIIYRAIKEPVTSVGRYDATPPRADRPLRARALLPGPGSHSGWLFSLDGRAVSALPRE